MVPVLSVCNQAAYPPSIIAQNLKHQLTGSPQREAKKRLTTQSSKHVLATIRLYLQLLSPFVVGSDIGQDINVITVRDSHRLERIVRSPSLILTLRWLSRVRGIKSEYGD